MIPASSPQRLAYRESRQLRQVDGGSVGGSVVVRHIRAGVVRRRDGIDQHRVGIVAVIMRLGVFDPLPVHAAANVAAAVAAVQTAHRLHRAGEHIAVEDAVDTVNMRPYVGDVPGRGDRHIADAAQQRDRQHDPRHDGAKHGKGSGGGGLAGWCAG